MRLFTGWRHLRDAFAKEPMINHFLQMKAEVTCCAHRKPNQVFLADVTTQQDISQQVSNLFVLQGAHYENLGVIPLLR